VKHFLQIALVISVVVIAGCEPAHDRSTPTVPAPAAVPARATLAQQEQCSQDSERAESKSLIVKHPVISSHFDPSSNRCVVLLDSSVFGISDDGVHATQLYKEFEGKELYDANERTLLAELGTPSGNGDEQPIPSCFVPATTGVQACGCWVADQAGVHRECNSKRAFDDLLKKSMEYRSRLADHLADC
jgi:hypothetical protein